MRPQIGKSGSPEAEEIELKERGATLRDLHPPTAAGAGPATPVTSGFNTLLWNSPDLPI